MAIKTFVSNTRKFREHDELAGWTFGSAQLPCWAENVGYPWHDAIVPRRGSADVCARCGATCPDKEALDFAAGIGPRAESARRRKQE